MPRRPAWQAPEDLLVEWERDEPVTIDVGEPMVSRSVRFPRQTIDRLGEVARARASA